MVPKDVLKLEKLPLFMETGLDTLKQLFSETEKEGEAAESVWEIRSVDGAWEFLAHHPVRVGQPRGGFRSGLCCHS